MGSLDPVSGEARVAADPDLAILDLFVRAAIALEVERLDGCLFHAACVVVDGRAYLCPGRSGSGKSTLASLARAPVSDEICAVLPGPSGPVVHATPWWRGNVLSAPLAGVLELGWDGERITWLSRPAGLRHLVSNLAVIIDRPASRTAAFQAAGAIAAGVPFGRMDFTLATDVDALLRGARAAA